MTGKQDISDHLRNAVASATKTIEIMSCDEILELALAAGVKVVFMDCSHEKQLIEFDSGLGTRFCMARYQSVLEFRKSFSQWAMSLRNHRNY